MGSIYKLFLAIIVLFFSYCELYCQTLCLKLDSIKVYYIPWSVTTPIAVEPERIIAGDYKEVTKLKSLTDSLVLAEFTEINIQNEKRRYEGGTSLDARMILILHIGKIVFQVCLNNFKSYTFLGYYYQFNTELIEWININITPCSVGPE